MTIPDARQRLIAAMTDALQRRGLHGSGLTEVLARAEAPKGVLYYHFPGGKTELAVAAINATVARVCDGLDRTLGAGGEPGTALLDWLDGARQRLDASGYERGCPLATIALETTSADAKIRAALAAGFAAIRERIADALAGAGLGRPQAAAMSALLVAAYEGGLLQSRVAGSMEPMSQIGDALLAILQLPQPKEDRRDRS
jgi:TetR/AcrR family transcriptional repressor of lmrAB and yxaGH operons